MLHKPRTERHPNRIYLCADSSGKQASGVWLKTPEGGRIIFLELINVVWSQADAARNINWKEATIALLTIRKALERLEDDILLPFQWVIVFGEDNSTAKCALNEFYYPRDARLCGNLFQLYKDLKGVELVSFYTPSADMAADELSRDKLIIPEKCEKHRQYLEKLYEDFGGNRY